MGARSDTLAKQFEAKAGEFTAVVEKLSDADWRAVAHPRQISRWSTSVADD